jgi:hypothetical protein
MVKRERQQRCSHSEQRRPRRRTTVRAVIRLTSSYSRAILTRGSQRRHDPDAPVPDSVALVPPSWSDAQRYLPIRATPYVLVRSSLLTRYAALIPLSSCILWVKSYVSG